MTARETLEALFRAGVAAADPYTATRRALDPNRLGARPWIIAIGKGATPMARGAIDALAECRRSPAGGVVVTAGERGGGAPPLHTVVGDHPVPGDRSLAAAEALGEVTRLVRPGDDVIVLVSGGASSLVAAPVEGITPAALAALFDGMLRSGAPIGTMNAFRRRVLRWGGGRLAQAMTGARLTVLVASDVIGGDLAAIASGPCAPDPLRASDLVEMATRQRLSSYIPPEVREYLDATSAGRRRETAKGNDPAFAAVESRIVLDNRVAVDAIAAAATSRGLSPVHVAFTALEGSARPTGEAIARAAVAAQVDIEPAADAGALLVWGGETTVRLGAGHTGVGGRSQELALAAAEVLHLAGEVASDVAILAAGTDGRDGPTDAAGAVVDATTWGRITRAGRDPHTDLERHDSYHALDAAGALMRPGMTGTNVNDVVLALLRP